MPHMSDDVEAVGGERAAGSGFRFRSDCKAVKKVQTRVLVLKQGCKCGQNHLFQTRGASSCKQWSWKVAEVLERVIDGIKINTASDIILGDKCSWEVLVPVEAYLKGWGVSRDWKFQGVFDRKSDLLATGFKSSGELVFALLYKEEICLSRYECDHRVLEVTIRAKEKPQEEAGSSQPAFLGDLLPSYDTPNEKQKPWDQS